MDLMDMSGAQKQGTVRALRSFLASLGTVPGFFRSMR